MCFVYLFFFFSPAKLQLKSREQHSAGALKGNGNDKDTGRRGWIKEYDVNLLIPSVASK